MTAPLLTREEVAALLRVDPVTVDRERKRGRLGFVKVGGRFLFAADQVEAYLSANRVDPTPKPATRERVAPRRDDGPMDAAAASRLLAKTLAAERKRPQREPKRGTRNGPG